MSERYPLDWIAAPDGDYMLRVHPRTLRLVRVSWRARMWERLTSWLHGVRS